MQLADRIKHIGNHFVDRLDPQVISDAVEYVDFSECKLAIEMLCDQLFEYNVPITSEEYQQLEQLAKETGADTERVEPLQSLVQSSSV
ncbi:MAG: MafI family immunity protein [Planctomycetaceae bacterium]|nr:MafI family immunity protein [Planctomycetaceae bacterium]